MGKKRIFDRFEEYMEYRGLTDYKVSKDSGVSNGTIGKIRTSSGDLSQKTIERILSAYPELNRVWLMTGDGEMINGNTITNTNTLTHSTNNGIIGNAQGNQTVGADMSIYVEQAKQNTLLIQEIQRQGERIDKLIELLSNK